MTDHNRRTLLKGLSAGAASTTGIALLGKTESAEAGEASTESSRQSEFSVDRVVTGHYEQDGDFEEKSQFEFSLDPRTGFDVKFELSGVRTAPNDNIRLVYSILLSDIVTGRLQVKSRSVVDENSAGGSMVFVWYGTPVGVNRLFNTSDWMENTNTVYGVVTNAGDGGVVDSNFASVDPA